MNTIKEIFKEKLFITGPDPLPWNLMFKRKNEDNMTWKEIHEMITKVDDSDDGSDSEWCSGETEESEDEESEEIDYPSEEESEKSSEYLTSSSDDCGYALDDNDDYDDWEDSTPKKRKAISDHEEETSNKKTKV